MLTKIDFVVKKHITIKYAFHLAVCNVERQIVSRFVTGVQMFHPIYNQKLLGIAVFCYYDFCVIGSLKLPTVSVIYLCFYFTIGRA